LLSFSFAVSRSRSLSLALSLLSPLFFAHAHFAFLLAFSHALHLVFFLPTNCLVPPCSRQCTHPVLSSKIVRTYLCICACACMYLNALCADEESKTKLPCRLGFETYCHERIREASRAQAAARCSIFLIYIHA